jgi:diguanylate cyclase (GGDEF)-like protein
MSDILYVISGLLLGLAFQGGIWFFLIPFALVSAALAWLNRPKLPESATAMINKVSNNPTTDATAIGSIFRKMPPTSEQPDLRTVFNNKVLEFNEPTSKLKIDQIWSRADTELNLSMSFLLKALKVMLPKTHTLGVFFLQGNENALVLRTYVSDSTEIVPNTLITANSGLISQILDPSVQRLLEGDLFSSKGLYYRSGSIPVKSIVATPIYDKDHNLHGALVVDSLMPNAFDASVANALSDIASVLFTLSFKSFASAKNFIEQQQFSILYHYQKKFFKNMNVKDIYKEIFEYVKGNIPYDRMMILALDKNNEEKGRVICCDGEDSELFVNQEFSLSDKGVVVLALLRNRIIERNFTAGFSDYTSRINETEKKNFELRHLFAMPIAIEENAEVADLAISLESKIPNRYSQHEKELLKTIAGVAGFAYERARAFEKGKDLATKDGLTGLINHRTLHEQLRTEKLRAERQKINIGVMMMDIDHFKSVNDTYGHPAGDEVIKGIASTIREEIRSEIDIVARYGGEEFVVALIDTTPEGLKDTAERIRLAIEKKAFDIHQSSPLKITVSIGAYLVLPEFRDMKQALKQADQALYKAKNSGRNQVFVYQKEEDVHLD